MCRMWPSPCSRGLGNLASASADLVARGARGPAEAAPSLGQPIRRQRTHAPGNFSLWSPGLHSAAGGPAVHLMPAFDGLPSVPSASACHAAQSGAQTLTRPHQSPQAAPAAEPTRVQALPCFEGLPLAAECRPSVPSVTDSRRCGPLPSLPGSSHSDASSPPPLQQTIMTASRSSCSSQSSVTSCGTVQIGMQEFHSPMHSQFSPLSQHDLSQPAKAAYSRQLPSQQLLDSYNSDAEKRQPSTLAEQATHPSAYQPQAAPLPAKLQLAPQYPAALQQQQQQMPDPGPPPMAPRQQSQYTRVQQLQAARHLQPAVRCQQMAPGLSRLPPLGRGFNSYEAASPCGAEDESEASGSVATSASHSDDELETQQEEQVLARVGIQPVSHSRFRRLVDDEDGLDCQSSTHSLKLALPPPPVVPPLAFLPASVYAAQCTSDGSGQGWRRPASAGAAARREWRADSALGHATVRLGA